MKKPKSLLQTLIAQHPDWNWEDLEDRGFYEIAQAYRHAPEGDQQTTVMAFTVIKEYIRYYFDKNEREKIDGLRVRKLTYRNKLFAAAYKAGIEEARIRFKKYPSKWERDIIALADKFEIDFQTTLLIWDFVNKQKRSQVYIINWVNKQQNKTKYSGGSYYKWLGVFIRKLTPDDFSLFTTKKEQLSEQVKKTTGQTLSITTSFDHQDIKNLQKSAKKIHAA